MRVREAPLQARRAKLAPNNSGGKQACSATRPGRGCTRGAMYEPQPLYGEAWLASRKHDRLAAGGGDDRVGRAANEGFAVILYVLVWRYGTVKASLFAGGLSGTVDAAQVVRVAQKQQERVAEALA